MADHIEANKENVKEVTQDPKEYAKKRSIFEWFEDTAWDGFCNLWKFFRDLVKKIGNQVIDSFVELLSVTIFSVGISKKKDEKESQKDHSKDQTFYKEIAMDGSLKYGCCFFICENKKKLKNSYLKQEKFEEIVFSYNYFFSNLSYLYWMIKIALLRSR